MGKVSEKREQERKGKGLGGFAAGSLHARLGVGHTHSCAFFSRPGWQDNCLHFIDGDPVALRGPISPST